MNTRLHALARQIELGAARHERLRLQFGLACVQRVAHLLEDPGVIECLRGLEGYLAGGLAPAAYGRLVAQAAQLARQHPGSRSIDGCGHAAVSATGAVAHALAGRATEAADYAAYAVVYAAGGHGAVGDRESFEPEFSWQLQCLAALAQEHAGG